MTIITIVPHDPVIARDGRPFGFGNRVHSLEWMYPSVAAGTIRSILGKAISPLDDESPFATLIKV
jgi:CRISPR-associated protein Cmr3